MVNTTCPLCNSDESLCTVSDVIHSGTTTSNTQGVTLGMFGTDEFSQMYFKTTTVSYLARLLSPPTKPMTAPWLFILILVGIAIAVLRTMASEVASNPDGGLLVIVWSFCLGIFTSFIPGVITGVLIYLILLVMYTPARKQWDKDCDTLLSSWYCQQDGIIIDEEGEVHSPVDYVDIVFSK